MKIQIFVLISLIFLSIGCSSLEQAEQLHQKGENEKALQMALHYLDSGSAEEQVHAIRLLVQIGTPMVGEKIAFKLNHTHPDVQLAAITAVGKLAYKPASPTLVLLIPNADSAMAEELARAIRLIGPPAIDLVVESFDNPSLTKDRMAYKKMLISVGPSVATSVARLLRGKTFFQGRDAFEILVAVRSPQVAENLLEFVGDDEVAAMVVDALSQLGSVAVDPILRKLKTVAEDRDGFEIQERLIDALGQIKDQRAVPTLEALSKSKSPLVRTAVDHALFKIRGF